MSLTGGPASVRAFLTAVPADTIQQFEDSSLDYLAAAEELLLSTYGAFAKPGVYRAGLAAEMLLKSAYFRLIGIPASHPIARAALRQAESEARRLGIPDDPSGFHSLVFWAKLIIEQRRDLGRLTSAKVTLDVRVAVDRLYETWDISIRYRTLPITLVDKEEVLEDVNRLFLLHEALWT
jgi:hypothetical protein